RGSGIQEPEYVRIVLARALKCKLPEDLVLAIDGLIPAGLQTVLMCDADHWNLVVIRPSSHKIGRWIKIQERLGLRADPAPGDDIAGKRRAGERVDDWVESLREIPRPLSRRRHQCGVDGGVAA